MPPTATTAAAMQFDAKVKTVGRRTNCDQSCSDPHWSLSTTGLRRASSPVNSPGILTPSLETLDSFRPAPQVNKHRPGKPLPMVDTADGRLPARTAWENC